VTLADDAVHDHDRKSSVLPVLLADGVRMEGLHFDTKRKGDFNKKGKFS
jgi:hypothetical protein